MAGPGVALRLHEFRDSRGSNQFDRSTGFTPKIARQGMDVRGLYPGQLGRVHVLHAQDHRVRFASLDHPPGPDVVNYEDYQRGFDLMTFRALDMLRHSSGVSKERPPETAYREEFGLQTPLYPPDNTKFTPYSQPGPMQLWSVRERRHF